MGEIFPEHYLLPMRSPHPYARQETAGEGDEQGGEAVGAAKYTLASR